MSKYDRFQGTPWEELEHCFYCGVDYKLDKNSPHSCKDTKELPIQSFKNEKPEEYCHQCRKGISKGEGRYRIFAQTLCNECGDYQSKIRWEA